MEISFSSSRTTILSVSGVDCSEKFAAIKSALKRTGEVREVQVSIVTGKTTIVHSEQLDAGDLIASLRAARLSARSQGETSETARRTVSCSALFSFIDSYFGDPSV